MMRGESRKVLLTWGLLFCVPISGPKRSENEAFLQSLLTLRAKGERSAFPELLRPLR